MALAIPRLLDENGMEMLPTDPGLALKQCPPPGEALGRDEADRQGVSV